MAYLVANSYNGNLELAKRLFRRFALRHPQHVESHRFRQRSTLACTTDQQSTASLGTVRTDGHNIPNLDAECRRDVHGKVPVSLLVPICVANLSDSAVHTSAAAVRTVLRNVVQIITPDDRSAGHFRGDDLAGQDATPDGHIASEWALLVCVTCLRSQQHHRLLKLSTHRCRFH